MRFYLLLLLLAPVLLASCNPEPSAGPRVDLVGGTRFLSASRASTTPADTFSTRMFADKRNGDDANISQLLITVDYTPTPNPYAYPATGFNRDSILPKVFSLVYLDSMVQGSQQQAVAFQFTANTRTTSGQELWTFRAYDTDGQSNARSYRLSLRNADSTLAYQRYNLLLPAPTGPGSRSYLSLLPGLTLPSYSLRQSPENQKLIDLAYLVLPNGGRALATPDDPTFMARSRFWTTRRATKLRPTSLDSAAFFATTTAAQLEAGFTGGGASLTSTGPLASRGTGRVFAFSTADTPVKYGLLFVQSIITAPRPAIRLQVRITK